MGEVRNTRCESRSDALHSEEDRRVVFALQGSGKTSQRANGCGWGVDVCFTLNATDVHGVCYAIDMGGGKSSCVVLDNQSPTLTCTHYGEPAVMYQKGNDGTHKQFQG